MKAEKKCDFFLFKEVAWTLVSVKDRFSSETEGKKGWVQIKGGREESHRGCMISLK